MAYGDGAYGKSDLSTAFTVGRNQVVKINTPDHVMNVYRDGSLTASYPSSNGKDADPNLNTPNGTVIVMQKDPVGDFSNPQYGYTNVMKKWAVRISNHGEFIHENNDNAANIGKVNSSHGCVNLLEADAKAYFDSALDRRPGGDHRLEGELPADLRRVRLADPVEPVADHVGAQLGERSDI